MRFVKGHVYACSFTWCGQELPAVFYGVYTHTVDKVFKHFAYISCDNYGEWASDEFKFDITTNITFIDLGTVKQNPELFI